MKNYTSILFFQFYRYPDELIEQSELKRAFVMNTTKGTTHDLTFTTETNVEGSTFCPAASFVFPTGKTHKHGLGSVADAVCLQKISA